MRLCLKSTLLFLVVFSSYASSRSKQAAEHTVLKPVTARFLSIPLQTPIGYAANDASVGDLDGDGEYDKPGPDEVKKFFPGDHTHTNKEGAAVNAASVAEGIRLNKNLPLNKFLIKP